ncbi:MAG: hypothetical protein RRY64_01900 [Oscillospiraceae bacterium]
MNFNTNNEHAHDRLLPCSDCGEMVPEQYLSLNLETEAFARTILDNIHRGTKPDMTNVDPQIVLCPNCRALREQAMNR